MINKPNEWEQSIIDNAVEYSVMMWRPLDKSTKTIVKTYDEAKDLLKAVHYVILLMSSEDEELIKQQTDPYHNQWGVNGEPKGRTQ